MQFAKSLCSLFKNYPDQTKKNLFNTILIYMNYINEKEKKLISVLDELKNLDLTNPELQNNIENLSKQKNQLEIEKHDLEEKYKLLKEDYKGLSKRLEEMQNKEKIEQKKQIEFTEKIDELNQETDTLLEEIDKWQT